LACDQGSIVGLCTEDYKSLCTAVTIYSTLVNIQTQIHRHRQHFDQLIWNAQPAELVIQMQSFASIKSSNSLVTSAYVNIV